MAPAVLTPRDRLLAAGGLVLNLLGFVLVAVAVALPDPLHTANLVLALAAGLPAAGCGTVACLALLQQRRWGAVLALVALGLQLLTLVPYAIVRLALVADGRGFWGAALATVLVAGLLLIVHWARLLARPATP
ncbi:MAG: hypothetical protein ACOYMY_08570 [Prochlorococcaceae cyanobacterium]|jgi:hypothetical protein